jgi:hypothetical protein
MLFSLGHLTDLTPNLLLGEGSPLQRMKMKEVKEMKEIKAKGTQEVYHYLT